LDKSYPFTAISHDTPGQITTFNIPEIVGSMGFLRLPTMPVPEAAKHVCFGTPEFHNIPVVL
jgi:hypothetical protein